MVHIKSHIKFISYHIIHHSFHVSLFKKKLSNNAIMFLTLPMIDEYMKVKINLITI
jgi:hypothetical protein